MDVFRGETERSQLRRPQGAHSIAANIIEIRASAYELSS